MKIQGRAAALGLAILLVGLVTCAQIIEVSDNPTLKTGGTGGTHLSSSTAGIGGMHASSSSSSTVTSGTGGGDGGPACASASDLPAWDGGACPTVVTVDSPKDYRTGLALLPHFVYAGWRYQGYLDRIQDGDGGIVVLGMLGQGFLDNTAFVATDGVEHVVWSDGLAPKMAVMDHDGNNAAPLADWSALGGGDGSDGMVVSNGYVYWTTQGPPAVLRKKINDFAPGSFDVIALIGNPISPATKPTGIAVDETYVYWIDAVNSAAAIQRMKLASIGAGDAGPSVAPDAPPFATNLGSPLGLAIDADRLYWDSGGSTVTSLLKSMPTMRQTYVYSNLNASPAGVTAIAADVDGAYVYWTMDNGFVAAANKAGGPGLTIACGPDGGGSAEALAVDCGAVYWTTSNGTAISGAVYKAAKPPP